MSESNKLPVSENNTINEIKLKGLEIARKLFITHRNLYAAKDDAKERRAEHKQYNSDDFIVLAYDNAIDRLETGSI
jgi:hypothetical protein